MTALSQRLINCLLEIARFTEGYPPDWKTKSRKRLEEMGLVEMASYEPSHGSARPYVLTDEGKRMAEAAYLLRGTREPIRDINQPVYEENKHE